MDRIIEVCDLEKWRGKRQVLQDVNFDVQRGEIIGVIGPNGSGKSTLIAILAGLLSPDAGAVRLCGQAMTRHNVQLRARCGVALQRPALSSRLQAREIITFFSRCYHGDRPLEEILKRFGLLEKQHVQTRHLSVGEQQRLSLALAFVKTFDVLFLDEPTGSLDPASRHDLWEAVQQARAQGTAVVYSTHAMDEAQEMSDRVLVLHAGRPVAFESPQTLLTHLGGRDKVEIRGMESTMTATLARLPGITHTLWRDNRVVLYCHSAREVLRVLLAEDSTLNITCGSLTLADTLPILSTHQGGQAL